MDRSSDLWMNEGLIHCCNMVVPRSYGSMIAIGVRNSVNMVAVENERISHNRYCMLGCNRIQMIWQLCRCIWTDQAKMVDCGQFPRYDTPMLQYDTDFWLVSERQHPEAWIDCGPESLQRCGISDADQHWPTFDQGLWNIIWLVVWNMKIIVKQ